MTKTNALAGLCAIMLVLAIIFWTLWDKEQAAHKATVKDFAQKEALYKANEKQAGKTIAALQGQLKKLDDSFAEFKANEQERHNIMQGAKPRQRTKEERQRTVDDATRKKVIDFLNTW